MVGQNRPVRSALSLLLSLLLASASLLLVRIIDFNAGHLFANPGFPARIDGPMPSSLAGWIVYVQLHADLRSALPLNPFEPVHGLVVLGMHLSPTLLVLLGHWLRGLRLPVLAAQCFVLAGLCWLFLQFPGYNGGNGGWDGTELMLLPLLPCLVGIGMAAALALAHILAAASPGNEG